MKISQRVFELLRRHEIMTDGQTDGQTERQTDGQTGGQGDYYRAPPTSSGGALIMPLFRLCYYIVHVLQWENLVNTMFREWLELGS